MDYFFVALTALLASGLTFFSGFGLGTLLLPVFAIFFPVDVAVALTAIVHLLNNLLKLALVGKLARKEVVLRFGLPALVASFLGAWSLLWLSHLKPLVTYHLFGHALNVMPVKLVVAVLMVIFVGLEIIPRFQKMAFDQKYLPLGGILSGFFGGLSGHQGALRSAFLLKCGLVKESFVATGVVIACLVDFARLSMYGLHVSPEVIGKNGFLLLTAIICAFLGTLLGNRLLKKVTMQTVQTVVSVMLLFIAVVLGMGIV